MQEIITSLIVLGATGFICKTYMADVIRSFCNRWLKKQHKTPVLQTVAIQKNRHHICLSCDSCHFSNKNLAKKMPDICHNFSAPPKHLS